MNRTQEQFLNELSESIRWHYSRYRLFIALEWVVMILIAVAGVFTAIAGSPAGKHQWFAEANALVGWGAITAIGTAINQFGNPGKSGEHHMKIKIALKAIRGAIQYRGLPVDQADKLKTTAWTNPEEAVEKLNQWPGPQTI